MKKVFLSLLLIFTTIISTTLTTSATDPQFNIYSAILHSDHGNTVLANQKADRLYTAIFNSDGKKSEKTYTFENDILAYCLSDNKIYVLYASEYQQHLNQNPLLLF